MTTPAPKVALTDDQWRDKLTAEEFQVLRQAGLAQPGWVSCQVCRLLSHLGHLLVVLGKRLQRYAMPAIPSVEQQRTSEAFSSR